MVEGSSKRRQREYLERSPFGPIWRRGLNFRPCPCRYMKHEQPPQHPRRRHLVMKLALALALTLIVIAAVIEANYPGGLNGFHL